MSVRDAAVRAVAEARCLRTPAWWNRSRRLCSGDGAKHPECAVAALAASADVRAKLRQQVCPDCPIEWHNGKPNCKRCLVVDAVLAALGGAE